MMFSRILRRSFCSMTSKSSSVCSLETIVQTTLTEPRDENRTQQINSFTTNYKALPLEDKAIFLKQLAMNFYIDRHQVSLIGQELLKSRSEMKFRLEEKLRLASTPQYVTFMKIVATTPGGVKFLVDLRKDILVMLKEQDADNIDAIKLVNNSLKELLSLWFSVGHMDLQRITWEDSTCLMLQKVSEYEAVHPMRSWTDLRSRVGPYRRCFVYTHHAMPNEPLVILHTALMPQIASSIKDIVKIEKVLAAQGNMKEVPELIEAAVFYSITSAQKGLQGIELGKHLIKDAVKELQREFPSLSTFSTLSPIPGFREWLVRELSLFAQGARDNLFTDDEYNSLRSNMESTSSDLPTLIKTGEWYRHPKLKDLLRDPLIRICAQYLYTVKHRGNVMNSVANFHLKNGAVLWRINWLADTTYKGLQHSCGLMANYRYFLDYIEMNAEVYAKEKKVVASQYVLTLMKDVKGVCAKSKM